MLWNTLIQRWGQKSDFKYLNDWFVVCDFGFFYLSSPYNYKQTQGSFWARCAKLHVYHPVLSVLFPVVFMGSIYGGLCRFYTCLKISSSDFFLDIWIFFSHPCVFIMWQSVEYRLFPCTVKLESKLFFLFPQHLSIDFQHNFLQFLIWILVKLSLSWMPMA